MAEITLGPADLLESFVYFISERPVLKSRYTVVTFAMLNNDAKKLVKINGSATYKDDRIVSVIHPPR